MHLVRTIFCFFFGTCQQNISPNDNYGITDRYIATDNNTPGAEKCYPIPACSVNSKYRTMDGSCNNEKNPVWGSATSTYERFLPANYSDGVKEIKKSRSGRGLPNVRLISRTLFPDIYLPDQTKSLALVQWGQILTHDSASTGFPVITNCCTNGQFTYPQIPQCYPISVPPGDRYYSQYNVICLSYTRVDTTETILNCPLKPQQTFSYVTHWLDLSLMYGTDMNSSDSTREFKGGLLKLEMVDGETMLPVTHEWQDFCRITSPNQSCINTGDVRTNQNPDLGVMSLVIAREHNRLAGDLAKLNPTWADEKLFQEARRINIAQAQHITYSEYLHHVLDDKYIKGMKLETLKSGFTEYNENMRGGTINEFTGSIFRTFHGTVQGDLNLIGGGRGRCPMKVAKLGNHWWTSGDVVLQCFEELAKGLLAQKARLYHNYVTIQESELFLKTTEPYGEDMISVDMMRGRDVGYQSYNDYRKVCGLSTFSSFQDLSIVMDQQVISKLEKLYENVNDIDLYVGALFEKPVAPGLTGPLVQCVMAQQFTRWKFPDRFYYEHKNQAGSFTLGQLNAIKKMTFSSLMCRNTKIGRIQRKGFYQVSPTNPVVACSDIQSVDLSPWKE